MSVVERKQLVASAPKSNRQEDWTAWFERLDDASRFVVANEVLNLFPLYAPLVLEVALRDRDELVRSRAVDAIGEAEMKAFVPQLLRLLHKDPSELVCAGAAESLGLIGDPQAVPHLIQALEDRAAVVRLWAAGSLGYFPSSPEIRSALHKLLTKERYGNVRVAAYSSLVLQGEERYFAHVLRGLRSHSFHARCAAANSLPEVIRPWNASRCFEVLAQAITKKRYRGARCTFYRTLCDLSERYEEGLVLLEAAYRRGDVDAGLYLCEAKWERGDKAGALEIVRELKMSAVGGKADWMTSSQGQWALSLLEVAAGDECKEVLKEEQARE